MFWVQKNKYEIIIELCVSEVGIYRGVPCFKVLRATKQLDTADHLFFYQLAHQRWVFKLIFNQVFTILTMIFTKKMG